MNRLRIQQGKHFTGQAEASASGPWGLRPLRAVGEPEAGGRSKGLFDLSYFTV